MSIIFSGPTIDPREASTVLAASYLPPAACGDVLAAAKRRPKSIGLIDGYFETQPAVWHKEILWAMSRGIPVYGSASMGALRASELATYGMRGIGRIYRAYRTGRLEDDDEVAVAHGPRELRYRPLSEAMVNIRATIGRAVDTGIISARCAGGLIDLAKRAFYKDRTYDRLLEDGRSAGLPNQDLRRLARWLPTGAIDQKRRDALSMLRAMRRALDLEPVRPAVTYEFQHTEAWHALFQSKKRRAPPRHT